MRHVSVYVFLLFSWGLSIGFRTQAQNDPSLKGISLELSIDKAELRPGGKPATFSVILSNKGADGFIATENLSPYVDARAFLVIESVDSKGKKQRLWQLQGMGVREQWWNRIQPDHFYGSEYMVDPADIDAIKKPGT